MPKTSSADGTGPPGPPPPPPPPPTPGPPRSRVLLTVMQAARVMNTSKHTVYRRIHSGELPAVDIGPEDGKPRLRVEETALFAYIDARQVA